jgi:hypothetical protein
VNRSPAELRAFGAGHRTFGAVDFLTVYLVLLFFLPARLVLPGIGAVGAPATLVGIFGFCWWVVATLLGQRQFVGFNPIRWALFGYMATILLSWTLGRLRPLTFLERTSSDRAILIMMSYAGVALVAMDGIVSWEDAQRLVRRMTTCAMAMVGSGIIQFFFGYDPNKLIQIPGLELNSDVEVGSRSIFNRPYGTALHPIEFGVVAAALIPLAYWIARAERRPRGYVVMAMLGFAAMTSLSRSAVLAAAVAGLVVLIGTSWQRRLAILATSSVFVVIAGMLVNGLVGTLKNLFTTAEDDTSVQARVSRTPRVLKLISEHPFIGRGFGTYNIDDYLLLDNQIQNVAIEMGLIGVAVLALFIGFVIVMAWRTRVGDEDNQLAGTVLIATIAGLIISSYTFDAFFYRILMGVLYLSIGVVGAMYRLTARARADRQQPARFEPIARVRTA